MSVVLLLWLGPLRLPVPTQQIICHLWSFLLKLDNSLLGFFFVVFSFTHFTQLKFVGKLSIRFIFFCPSENG